MKVNRDDVLAYLRELEERNGGYYGTDLMNLAEKLGVTWRGLKKRLMKWLNEDKVFIGLHYLGMHNPSITLNELMDIENQMASNPLKKKSHIYSDINKKREASGKESITKPTFYRAAKQPLINPTSVVCI